MAKEKKPGFDGSVDDILEEAREAYERASDYEQENRELALDDLRFARMGEQWPNQISQQRKREGRPQLTINRLPSFIRQVVNDARQNKPSIKVRPVDSGADPDTAEVFNGIIRHIEQVSNADVAYDTAADFAVTCGMGYFRIDVDYAHDDTFDQDIRIERVANPFSVFGDPYSTAADSSDWNTAFVVEPMALDLFQSKYKGAEEVDWEETGYTRLQQPWFDAEHVMVAEYWRREEVSQKLLRLQSGLLLKEDVYGRDPEYWQLTEGPVVADRDVKGHQITHRLMTGAEILETNEWHGRYIPIVPVYGDEVNVEGRRYFLSLIRHAKDAQRMFNYWRTASTELVALAPKAPFVGPEKAFNGKDARKWESANTNNWSYLAYGGDVAPQRQPFAGVPAGAIQEAMNASDDLKSIMGLYDASLGARSNETSGRAIMARQREGDVSTFHFIDNLSRAIRHAGTILLDLIPLVYKGPRIARILGQDGSTEPVLLGPANGQTMIAGQRIYDVTAGKYDLVVEAGPSYTTRREEAAAEMIELLRVMPQAAVVVGDLLVKNLDWPGADEIAKRLKALVPAEAQGEDPRLQQAAVMIQTLEGKLREVLGDRAVEQFEAEIKARDSQTKAYDAETKRIAALGKMGKDMVDATSPPGPYDRYQNGGAS